VGFSSVIDSSLIGGSVYNAYTANGHEVSKEPFIEIFAVRDLLGIPITTSMTATLYEPKVECRLEGPGGNEGNTTGYTCTDPIYQYSLLNGTCVV
jgi:hypothetical protein